MKINKIFQLAAIAAVTLSVTACSNEEGDYFSESAAQRLDEAPALYSQRLVAAQNGWAFQYFPTTETSYPEGIGYLMLAKFSTNGSVTIGMNNVFTGSRYGSDTSAWQVITDDGPVLSFNTYNSMLHSFSNPDDIPWIMNGSSSRPHISVQGTGIGGDYEFVITEAPEDGSYIRLKGKKRGTYSLLTPLADGTDFATYLQDVNDFRSKIFATNAPNTYLLNAGSRVYQLSQSQGFLNYYPDGSDPVITTEQEPFLITNQNGKYVLRTRDALSLDDGNVSVQEFTYDADQDIFVGTADSACSITSTYSSAKAFVDASLASGKSFVVPRKTSGMMSDKMQAYVDKVDNDIYIYGRSLRPRQTLHVDSLVLMQNADGNPTWNFKINSTSDYNSFEYTKVEEGDNVTYTFANYGNDGAQVMSETFESVKTLLETVLAQQWTVTPLETKFNYARIRFTSVADPELWFTASFSNYN